MRAIPLRQSQQTRDFSISATQGLSFWTMKRSPSWGLWSAASGTGCPTWTPERSTAAAPRARFSANGRSASQRTSSVRESTPSPSQDPPNTPTPIWTSIADSTSGDPRSDPTPSSPHSHTHTESLHPENSATAPTGTIESAPRCGPSLANPELWAAPEVRRASSAEVLRRGCAAPAPASKESITHTSRQISVEN